MAGLGGGFGGGLSFGSTLPAASASAARPASRPSTTWGDTPPPGALATNVAGLQQYLSPQQALLAQQRNSLNNQLGLLDTRYSPGGGILPDGSTGGGGGGGGGGGQSAAYDLQRQYLLSQNPNLDALTELANRLLASQLSSESSAYDQNSQTAKSTATANGAMTAFGTGKTFANLLKQFQEDQEQSHISHDQTLLQISQKRADLANQLQSLDLQQSSGGGGGGGSGAGSDGLLSADETYAYLSKRQSILDQQAEVDYQFQVLNGNIANAAGKTPAWDSTTKAGASKAAKTLGKSLLSRAGF